MLKLLALAAASALALAAPATWAAENFEPTTTDRTFSFEGPFGTFDELQLQRGLQVYTAVCAACHGLKFVPIRSLSDEGGPRLPEDQVRAYATAFSVNDEASNQNLIDPASGELRPLTPADNFPANASMNAPDLSLMAKARAGYRGPYGTGLSQLFNGMGGPEHIFSILTGYTGQTKEEAGSTFYENKAFSTGWIAMPPPLSDDQVAYQDGTKATLAQEAEDVSAFLMWAAEPKMMARKQVGFIAVVFLGLLTALLFLTNKRLWSPVKGKPVA